MVVIYGYFKRDNDKVLKFHINMKASTLNKHQG